MIYLDSSRLVKLYVREPDSAATIEAVAKDGHLVVSDIAFVEFHSALRRRLREGALAPELSQEILDRFDAEWPGFDRVPVSNLVLHSATGLLARHPLRSLDAIQLASALLVSPGGPDRIRFSSADLRLRETARAEGLDILPG